MIYNKNTFAMTILGDSMNPTFSNGDIVKVQSLKHLKLIYGRCYVYMIKDTFILHRLIGKKHNKFVFCGDNQISYSLIDFKSIVGALDEKYFNEDNIILRFIDILLIKLMPVPKILMRLRRKIRRLLKRNLNYEAKI